MEIGDKFTCIKDYVTYPDKRTLYTIGDVTSVTSINGDIVYLKPRRVDSSDLLMKCEDGIHITDLCGDLYFIIYQNGTVDEPSTIAKGTLAICGIGCLGLITEGEPKEITYPDGNTGVAYVGIHLTDKVCKIGDPWSSKRPKVVGHTDDYKSSI